MKGITGRLGMAFAVLAAGVLAAAPSMAQDKAMSPIPGTFSANVAVTTEYYFRGLSQTDDKPAVQGGFDYEIPVAKPASLYLGVWGSNVDFNDGSAGASLEMDWYGGFKGDIGDTGLSWNAGFIYYSYPGASSSLNYDFWEVQGSLGYDFGVAAVTGSFNYSPDNFGESGNAYYPKFAVDVPIPMVKGLTLSGYVAKQWIEKNDVFGVPDYVEWNISASYSIPSLVDLSLAYSDTDVSPSGDGNKAAVIFTVSKSF